MAAAKACVDWEAVPPNVLQHLAAVCVAADMELMVPYAAAHPSLLAANTKQVGSYNATASAMSFAADMTLRASYSVAGSSPLVADASWLDSQTAPATAMCMAADMTLRASYAAAGSSTLRANTSWLDPYVAIAAAMIGIDLLAHMTDRTYAVHLMLMLEKVEQHEDGTWLAFLLSKQDFVQRDKAGYNPYTR